MLKDLKKTYIYFVVLISIALCGSATLILADELQNDKNITTQTKKDDPALDNRNEDIKDLLEKKNNVPSLTDLSTNAQPIQAKVKIEENKVQNVDELKTEIIKEKKNEINTINTDNKKEHETKEPVLDTTKSSENNTKLPNINGDNNKKNDTDKTEIEIIPKPENEEKKKENNENDKQFKPNDQIELKEMNASLIINNNANVNNNTVDTQNVQKNDSKNDEQVKIPQDTLKKLEDKIIQQSEQQEKQSMDITQEKIGQQKHSVLNEVIKEEQQDVVETSHLEKEKLKQAESKKKIDDTTKNEEKNIDLEKLFTIFDKKKALNFDYNKIKYRNFELLERKEELNEIKEAIKLSLNDDKKSKNKTNNKDQKNNNLIYGKVNNDLRIYSLVYLNDKDWKARVNRENVNNKTKDRKSFNGTIIVKSNKTSMIFLLLTPNKMVQVVQKIQEENGSYSKNYYLVKEGNDTYIAFKLFIGQTINLDTMKIKG